VRFEPLLACDWPLQQFRTPSLLSRCIKVSKLYKGPGSCSSFGCSKSRNAFCKFLVTFLQQTQAITRLRGGNESPEVFFTCSGSACREGSDLVAGNIWFPTLQRCYKKDQHVVRRQQARRLYARTENIGERVGQWPYFGVVTVSTTFLLRSRSIWEFYWFRNNKH
jgi:hypothetical protein